MLLVPLTIAASRRERYDTKVRNPLPEYLLSLPERVLRSATALAAGLVREIGEAALPAAVRRTRIYQTMVEATLRFLIEQVGEVEDAYPPEGKLTEDFLLRRTAGNGIELVGILTFRASPVWVMAALADLSGTGRYLIQEIAASLQQEGLLEPGTEFHTVDQLLDGLEGAAGRLAEAINTPPLDVASLRQEWSEIRRHAASIPTPALPSPNELWQFWHGLQTEAQVQERSVFELSSMMALSAVRGVPANLLWLSRSARSAARHTGRLVAGNLLDHYRTTLIDIHETGYLNYCVREFRPYLRAAAGQFALSRISLTQRLLRRGARN